ncbi:MAG: hypothetical protein AMXMBFR33_17500 [Candidatus Xenobia bacterium]
METHTTLRFFTVDQVADMVQLTRARVYDAIRQKLLPAVHIGRQVRIEEQGFREWVRQGGSALDAGWRHQN